MLRFTVIDTVGLLMTSYVVVILSNFAFVNSRHNLVNDNMIKTESFLYKMLCIREGVF